MPKNGWMAKHAFTLAALTSLSLFFAQFKPTDADEVLSFRLAREKTIHLKDGLTAKSYSAALNNLGCSHRLDRHASHVDLTMYCRHWRDAEFADHGIAHKWQGWLESLGFETKHNH